MSTCDQYTYAAWVRLYSTPPKRNLPAPFLASHQNQSRGRLRACPLQSRVSTGRTSTSSLRFPGRPYAETLLKFCILSRRPLVSRRPEAQLKPAPGTVVKTELRNGDLCTMRKWTEFPVEDELGMLPLRKTEAGYGAHSMQYGGLRSAAPTRRCAPKETSAKFCT